MTTIFNYLVWGAADPDKPDPMTDVSMRDLYHIRKSWAKLYHRPIETGMMLFIKLFQAEPSTQDFFSTIKGQPKDVYANLPQFKAHVLGVIASINVAVTTMHEPLVVVEHMKKLGRTHRRFHVQPEHFNVVAQVLVDMLKNDFHAKDDVIDAWSKLVAFLYKPLFEELTAE